MLPDRLATLAIHAGRLRTRMDDGTAFEIGPGEIAITAPGHDAWVVGDEPCAGLDIAGASRIGESLA